MVEDLVEKVKILSKKQKISRYISNFERTTNWSYSLRGLIRIKVWFGECEAETIVRSDENMIAVVPDRSLVQPDWNMAKKGDKLDVNHKNSNILDENGF